VSVLKGEGKVEILFGSTSISAGSRVHRGYLARPDRTGEWPTIVLVAPAWGVTSSVKDVCRRIARRGFAVVAPDLYRGKAPTRRVSRAEAEAAAAAVPARQAHRDLADIAAFITNPAGFWSSAEHGFGVMGMGIGGPVAVRTAVAHGAPALALVYSPLGPDDVSALARFRGTTLGLYGRRDEVVPPEEVSTVRDEVPRLQLVMYGDAGHDFLDDYGDGYDAAVAGDAVERLTEFFAAKLPPGPS
jgi:carboxymethylenebutenolidase